MNQTNWDENGTMARAPRGSEHMSNHAPWKSPYSRKLHTTREANSAEARCSPERINNGGRQEDGGELEGKRAEGRSVG
eukprot:2189421-Rhodomonas_salina.1